MTSEEPCVAAGAVGSSAAMASILGVWMTWLGAVSAMRWGVGSECKTFRDSGVRMMKLSDITL